MDIENLNRSLNPKYLKESYKLYWFLAILEEIKNKDKRTINQRDLAITMVIHACRAIKENDLIIGKNDKLTETIKYLINHNKIKISKNIKEDLYRINDLEFEKLLKEITHWVKYRFLTSFYDEELKGVLDSRRNKKIDLLSQNNTKIYEITEETIILENDTFEYLKANNSILNDWLKYKFLVFLKLKNNDLNEIYDYITKL